MKNALKVIFSLALLGVLLYAAFTQFSKGTTIQKHEHRYTTKVLKQASCTEKGSVERTCSCGHVVVEDTDYAHQPIDDLDVAPTCITAGSTGGSHCELCQAVVTEPTVIEATGHNFKDGFCTACDTPEPTEGLAYQLSEDGNSYIVIGIGDATGNSLCIPTTYEGKPVTAIAEEAFKGNTQITALFLQNTIVTIGDAAFENCTALKDVLLPDSITSISTSLFSNCIALEGITIPNSVTSIEDKAFSGCTALSAVIVHDDITNIGAFAFNNTGLVFANLPSGVVTIGDSAFKNCAALTTVTLPSGITSIGKSLFENCTSLKNIVIPAGVTTIEFSAFAYCSSLQSVNLPSTITTFGDSAFKDCTKLEGFLFKGTVDQWKAIAKGNKWNASMPAYTVRCSDGSLAESGK